MPGLPVVVFFVSMMVAMSFRNVAYNTLTSRVPPPALRARFMSFQSAVQHLAAAAGAFLSSQLLDTVPGSLALDGMSRVAAVAMALAAVVPPIMWRLERSLGQ